jgi:hypothetical protein
LLLEDCGIWRPADIFPLHRDEVGFDPVAELVFDVCQGRRRASGVRNRRCAWGRGARGLRLGDLLRN